MSMLRQLFLPFVLLSTAATIMPISTTVALAAAREKVIHNFAGSPDGANPEGGTLLATFNAKGSIRALYGTTAGGGKGEGNPGTVFKITPNGTKTILHSFGVDEGDGVVPYGGVVMDGADNLYGTTWTGGQYGAGTIYKLAPDGSETILHAFTGGDDGGEPHSGLVMDKNGNLYGTTSEGGINNQGTIFKLSGDGTEVVLHSYLGTEGAAPIGIALDNAGILYGVTVGGGPTGNGTVYKLTRAGKLIVLHYFTGDDGALPYASPLIDAQGNLYGTTQFGGAHSDGVVFKITASGGFETLHAFKGGSDGSDSLSQLVQAPKGTLYGTTRFGGGSENAGTVFRLAPDGKEKVLHAFGAAGDGTNPFGGLVMDSSGNLYGTTDAGGTEGVGTVFKVSLADAP